MLGHDVQIEQMINIVVYERDHNRMNRRRALTDLIKEPHVQVELRSRGRRRQERVRFNALIEKVNA